MAIKLCLTFNNIVNNFSKNVSQLNLKCQLAAPTFRKLIYM